MTTTATPPYLTPAKKRFRFNSAALVQFQREFPHLVPKPRHPSVVPLATRWWQQRKRKHRGDT